MKLLMSLTVAAAMLCVSPAIAKDFESGLQKGASLGAFDVVKCAGEEADTVALGDKLCYRCRNGSRPQVIVFTRSTGKEVTELVKKLDAHVKKFDSEQLRAFVNVMGESKQGATKSVETLAASAKTKNIPYVVPVEFENGPENYGINPKAELTIIVANESKVVANFAVESVDKFDSKAVLASVKKMLN